MYDISMDTKKKTVSAPNSTRNMYRYFLRGHHAVLGFFVNLLAAFSYLSRVISGQTCTADFNLFSQAEYLEYVTTCPILVLDLLWNLEAPFKWCAGADCTVCIPS